jgi:cob(I)alamin adenosyltransferase
MLRALAREWRVCVIQFIKSDEYKVGEKQLAEERIGSGDYRLVILDEITYPMNWRWIDSNRVVEAIARRPVHVNVLATGRDAPAALVQVADTVTEMVKVKHAFDRGVRARRGIDF